MLIRVLFFGVMLFSSIAMADILDDDGLTQLEVQASARQLLYELKQKPLEMISPAILASMEQALPKLTIASDLWKPVSDSRFLSAIALRSLLQTVDQGAIADQATDLYFQRNNIAATSKDLSYITKYGAPATYNRLSFYYMSCRTSATVKETKTGKTFSIDQKLLNYVVSWRNTSESFELSLNVEGSSEAAALLIASSRHSERRTANDLLHSELETSSTTIQNWSGELKRVDSPVAIVRQTLDPSKTAFSRENQSNQSVGVTTYEYLGGLRYNFELVSDGKDLPIAIEGYEGTKSTTHCERYPAKWQDSLSPYLKTVFSRFDGVSVLVEGLRQTWLRCLTSAPAAQCLSYERTYRESTKSLLAAWNQLLDPKEAPTKILSSSAVAKLVLRPESKAAPRAESENFQSTNTVSGKATPPFKIPRECSYRNAQGALWAYCDGSLVCKYSNATTATCQGEAIQSCQKGDGDQVTCR